MKDKLINSGKKILSVFSWIHDTIQNNYKKSSQSIDILEKKLSDAEKISKQETTIWRDHWSFWIIWLVCIGIWFAAFKIITLLYLVITAFILSMAIESIIWFFEKRCRRSFSIWFSYFLVIIFLLSAVIIVIPFILAQLIELGTVILEQIASWQATVQQKWLETVIMETNLPGQIKQRLQSLVLWDEIWWALQTALMSNVDQFVSFWSDSLKNAWGYIVTLLTWFFSVAVQIMLVMVMAIFFSIEKKSVIHFLATVSWHVDRTELVLMKLYRKLWLRLRWQWLLCITIFFMVWIWLNVLSWVWFDLPNKMTLALIAWMLEFIPYLWPFLWMFPALLIWLSQYGFYWFIAVLILYVLIQQLENNILVPMVMSHTLWTSPLLILICMILWWSLFGFLWILLAVPIAVIISILYATYSNNK